MLNITDEHKALYWADSTHKTITISSMDNSFEDITNDRIHSESLSITEILCDEDNIKFGKCGGSEISITVSGVDDSITGKEILIEISIDDNTLPLGIFKIDKPSMSVNRGYKALHGYDRMNRLDVDVSEWYSALYTNAAAYTVKQLRDSLFIHLDLEQEEITLINDDVVVSETLDASNGISARKIIEDICEINGVFGRFDRYGVFTYVTLFRNLIYPSNNLYPSPSIYPGMELDPLHNELTEFKSCAYEEYTMYPIDSLYVSYDDVAVKIGTTDTSTYSITDNFIVIGQGENQLTSIARGLYTKIHGIKLRPNETDVRGLPYFEVGDYYTVDNGEDIIQSYIFKRTLSGIQALSDSFSAKGDEYLVRDTTSNNAQIVSKVASYTKRQLSNYDLQVQNMTTVITQAFGLYRVEVPQANGSTKFYMCDAPTLETSTNVWQFTSGGIMQSTDGGTTWGIDNNGNALFNSVVAHKISADWLEIGGSADGVLNIKDSFGNAIIQMSKNGIELANGASLITDTGVCGDLTFISNGGSPDWLGYNAETLFETTALVDIVLSATIPSDFVVTSAIITVMASGTYWTSFTAATSTTFWGYPRAIKLYYGSDGGIYRQAWYPGSWVDRANSGWTQLVTGGFTSGGVSANANETTKTIASGNLVSYVQSGKTNHFRISSPDGYSGQVVDEHLARTGIATAILSIKGYTKN